MTKSKEPYQVLNSRKFPRLKVSYLMKYFEIDETGREIIRTANTKDLSAGGLKFLTPEPPHRGSVLRIQVLIPAAGVTVGAFAKVVCVIPASESQPLATVGVNFIEMSEKDQAAIQDLIGRLLKTPEKDFLFDERSKATRHPGGRGDKP